MPLVITRKIGEAVEIGDKIVVRYLERQGNQIRLSIEAPKDLQINRQEVAEKIRIENNPHPPHGAKDGKSLKD